MPFDSSTGLGGENLFWGSYSSLACLVLVPSCCNATAWDMWDIHGHPMMHWMPWDELGTRLLGYIALMSNAVLVKKIGGRCLMTHDAFSGTKKVLFGFLSCCRYVVRSVRSCWSGFSMRLNGDMAAGRALPLWGLRATKIHGYLMGAGSVAAAFGPGTQSFGASLVFLVPLASSWCHPATFISCQCADPYELVDPGRSHQWFFIQHSSMHGFLWLWPKFGLQNGPDVKRRSDERGGFHGKWTGSCTTTTFLD